MVPSNSDHFDLVSTWMLNDQYLYVLEDNTDGIYAEYFKFGIKELDISYKRFDRRAGREHV